jgi:hypothetical protein
LQSTVRYCCDMLCYRTNARRAATWLPALRPTGTHPVPLDFSFNCQLRSLLLVTWEQNTKTCTLLLGHVVCFCASFVSVNYRLQYCRHLTTHLNKIQNFLFLLSWLFNHSTNIISYNTDIIYLVPKTDIFNWNKAENLLIAIYG